MKSIRGGGLYVLVWAYVQIWFQPIWPLLVNSALTLSLRTNPCSNTPVCWIAQGSSTFYLLLSFLSAFCCLALAKYQMLVFLSSAPSCVRTCVWETQRKCLESPSRCQQKHYNSHRLQLVYKCIPAVVIQLERFTCCASSLMFVSCTWERTHANKRYQTIPLGGLNRW